MKHIAAIALSFVLAPLLSGAEPSLILTGGRIFTGDTAYPSAEALAIEGNRIVAVGTNDEIRAKAGKTTRVIDVKGKFVIPGFNDAHTHFGWSGESFLASRDFRASWDAVRAAITAAADETPADMWISAYVGQSVVLDPNFTNEALDKAAPGRKVAVSSLGSHSMTLSSAAMAALGVAPDAKDPVGGWFGRDAAGKVNGHAYEYALWPITRKLAGLGTDDEIVESIRTYSTAAVRLGVTSVQNMSFVPDDRFVAALKKANVPLRVRAIVFPSSIDDPISKRPGAGLKWILDGSPIERTAGFRTAAYPDGTKGRENFSDVTPLIRKAIDSKQQLLVHVLGDKAAESALRAIAKTSLQRPRLEHVHNLPSDLLPLAKQTGVIAVINPWHTSFREYYPKEGEYLTAASIASAGIPIAIGSDGIPSPFVNFQWAIDRKDESERLSREDALRAYTSGSAFAELKEKEKGKIAPGMLADIAVLSQNILEVPANTLPSTRSVLTIIDGKIVHDE
ncbi:MAG TPA: amidohydrolase family protein [Thermoanaerobaculia bacterium]|jgi:hypothetical protein|nr:amidohydrolase family protein [Thermoanaerobaculia bacterium]